MTLHVCTYVATNNCMFWKPLEQRILLSFCGSHFVWIEPHGMYFPRRESVRVSHRGVACGASSALSKANRCGSACYVIDTENTSIYGCVYWDKPQMSTGDAKCCTLRPPPVPSEQPLPHEPIQHRAHEVVMAGHAPHAF